MQKILLTLVLYLMFVIVSGCLGPAYYRFTNEKSQMEEKPKIQQNNLSLTLIGAHPWREKQNNKFVVINSSILNLSNTDKTVFISNAMLFSKTDSFALNFETTRTANNYMQGRDSFILQPKEEKMIDFFFCSKNDYSRVKYNKSIESDTLEFRFGSNPQKIFLIGKQVGAR